MRPQDGVVKSPYDEQPIVLKGVINHSPAKAALVWLQQGSASQAIIVAPTRIQPKLREGNELIVRVDFESLLIKTFILDSYQQRAYMAGIENGQRVDLWAKEEVHNLVVDAKKEADQKTVKLKEQHETGKELAAEALKTKRNEIDKAQKQVVDIQKEHTNLLERQLKEATDIANAKVARKAELDRICEQEKAERVRLGLPPK